MAKNPSAPGPFVLLYAGDDRPPAPPGILTTIGCDAAGAPAYALEAAIFIAGGAGLVIARGLLFPGELPRRISLSRAGALGVRMVLGTIPLLIVAGSMEGFVSPSNLPAPVKFAVSAMLGTALVLYLRSKRSPHPAVAPE